MNAPTPAQRLKKVLVIALEEGALNAEEVGTILAGLTVLKRPDCRVGVRYNGGIVCARSVAEALTADGLSLPSESQN